MKAITLLLLGLCFSFSAKCQSVFYMEYRFKDIADTNLYHVFLVRNDDGTGFYRVRFNDDEEGDMVVELDMKEMYYTDKNGYTDTTKLYLKGFSPRVIYGKQDYKYYPERFWFKYDPNTDNYEPWAVTSPDEQGTVQGKFVEPPTLVEAEDLTKDFVNLFFFEDDDFYKNLFEVKTRAMPVAQTKLNLVVVANTEDDAIGNTCMLDKDRTIKMFKDLAEFLKIKFNPTAIFGSNFSKDNVVNAVRQLTPGKNDITVFYYSGHGFNEPGSNRTFPNMALSNKSFDDAMKSSMNIEDVYNMIRSKGGRFNLVLSDCCNNNPDDRASLSCDIPRTRSSQLGWNYDNCRSLFLDDKPMSILMTASQKGELSSGNGTYGGFFTNQFRSNLTTYFGPFHQFPNWDTILAEAKKNTTDQAENSRCSESNQPLKTFKQHPVYKILKQ